MIFRWYMGMCHLALLSLLPSLVPPLVVLPAVEEGIFSDLGVLCPALHRCARLLPSEEM
jgi:hypothetical protein